MLKKNLIKKDLSNKIFQNLGFSKSFSLYMVDFFFNCISDELVKLKKVKISSFGTFEIMNKNARMGRNPKTKIDAKISARKIVKFKPSFFMKKKINQK